MKPIEYLIYDKILTAIFPRSTKPPQQQHQSFFQCHI